MDSDMHLTQMEYQPGAGTMARHWNKGRRSDKTVRSLDDVLVDLQNIWSDISIGQERSQPTLHVKEVDSQ